jgi:hypothetical protein
MKKGLLLSVVATGFIFAGGNIAPVAPVQPQVAPAACDFWGTLAVRYDAKKDGDVGLGKKENNLFATAIAMAVEKQLGYGFGFGAEFGAFTDLGLDVAGAVDGTTSELSQLYLTYKTGNTAIKAGRQALPKALSPLAWSDRTAGVLDTTYEGVVVVNTDIKDTTLVGAWVARYAVDNKSERINGENNKGVFMLAMQNKSLENTTITASVYYAPKPLKATSAWLAVEGKAGSVNLGLQVAYSKFKGLGLKKTLGVAAYAGGNFNGLDAKLTLAYIDDGQSPLKIFKGGSGFWGASYYVFGGNTIGAKQKIAKLDLAYKIEGYGKVYGGVAADKADGKSTAVAARIGYDFKVADVNAKVEYRYHKDFDKVKHHRIRVQGVYKF